MLNVFKSANLMILMAYGLSIGTLIKLCYPLVNGNGIPASPYFGERLSELAIYYYNHTYGDSYGTPKWSKE
jgi:hypothetical protein